MFIDFRRKEKRGEILLEFESKISDVYENVNGIAFRVVSRIRIQDSPPGFNGLNAQNALSPACYGISILEKS